MIAYRQRPVPRLPKAVHDSGNIVVAGGQACGGGFLLIAWRSMSGLDSGGVGDGLAGGEGLPQQDGAARVSVHAPVLVREVLDLLDLAPGLFVVDGTVGAGGHASAIAERIAPGGRILGLDRDGEILVHARAALDSTESVSSGRTKVSLQKLPFSEVEAALVREGVSRCDRVLLDLGVSSLQLDVAERGFSFMIDGPLDMRMDRSSGLPASEWLARVPEQELARVIYEYGEERFSRRIAAAIVAARRARRIERTRELREIVRSAMPVAARHQRIDPATRTFQALRIAVNGELDQLEKGLRKALACLALGGRLCVISFHSLEDRIVKHFMKDHMRPLTKKPVEATAAETERNPRARSAKLRCAIVKESAA